MGHKSLHVPGVHFVDTFFKIHIFIVAINAIFNTIDYNINSIRLLFSSYDVNHAAVKCYFSFLLLLLNSSSSSYHHHHHHYYTIYSHYIIIIVVTSFTHDQIRKRIMYRLGTNFGHFQALFNVLRFSQTFPAKFTCIQLLHILSIIKHLKCSHLVLFSLFYGRFP